jgi:hypothetical protein
MASILGHLARSIIYCERNPYAKRVDEIGYVTVQFKPCLLLPPFESCSPGRSITLECFRPAAWAFDGR